MAAVESYQNQEGENEEMNAQQQQQQQQQQLQQQQLQQQDGNDDSGQRGQPTAGIPGKDDERKLFVGGLSRNTTDKELRDHFGKFGEIESISVKMDQYTGLSRGFAFMVFTNPKTIDKLLASGEHYINKRKVDPKRVSKKAQYGKIFVGGLTPDITDEDIKSYFSQFGTIMELQAPFDKLKNQRKGFCFITFDSRDVVYKLLKTPKQTINGREVDVKKVKVNPEANRPGFWGAGYGYGYGGGYGYIPEPNDYHGGYNDSTSNFDYNSLRYHEDQSLPLDGYMPYAHVYMGANKPRGNGAGPRPFQRHQPY